MAGNNNFIDNFSDSESEAQFTEDEYTETEVEVESSSEYAETEVESSSEYAETEVESSSRKRKISFSEENFDDEKGSFGNDIIFSLATIINAGKRKAEGETVGGEDSIQSKKIKTEKNRIDLLRNKGSAFLRLEEKVLLSELSDQDKIYMIERLEDNVSSSDKSKTVAWANNVLKLPAGKFITLPVNNSSPNEKINSFLLNAREILDNTVYGMNSTKEEILDFLAKFINNKESRGTVLGLHGKPGLGKTKLCLALSKILSLPFFKISCGGLTDSSVLVGHDSTYIGSKCGIIVDNLIRAKCLNPIVLLDEIDKLGNENSKAAEVYGILTHLLDETQNNDFRDLYLGNISIDLSKALFITTFNDISKIDPIVLNRIKVISIDSLTTDEKIKIVQTFVIPELCKKNGLKVSISSSLIDYIISRKSISEPGMRNINKNMESVIGKLVSLKLIKEKCLDNERILKGFSYKNYNLTYNKSGAIEITKEFIDTVLKESDERGEAWMSMYS